MYWSAKHVRANAVYCSDFFPSVYCFAHWDDKSDKRASQASYLHTFIDGIGLVGSMCLHYVVKPSCKLAYSSLKRPPRTSLSALTCQAPYVITNIPANATAVFIFQFEGRVHQPPRSVQY